MNAAAGELHDERGGSAFGQLRLLQARHLRVKKATTALRDQGVIPDLRNRKIVTLTRLQCDPHMVAGVDLRQLAWRR